jgi:hypothetical protein
MNEFFNNIKYTIASMFKMTTLTSNPIVVSIVSVLLFYTLPLLFVLYVVFIAFMYDTTELTDEQLNAPTSDTVVLDIPYKSGDDVKTFTVEVKPELAKVECVFELLFRDHDAILIRGFDVANAIDNAKLTENQKADFVGAVQV